MRTMLDCDAVFDVLTSGPFPQGKPTDISVEDHLRACHECRQLAEALRPAVGLLHESLDDVSLPQFHSPLALPASVSLPGDAPGREHRDRKPTWLTIGLAATLLLAAFAPTWRRDRSSATPSPMPSLNVSHDSAWQTLNELPLSAACLRFANNGPFQSSRPTTDQGGHPRLQPIADRPLMTAQAWRSLCCTGCHHLNGEGPMTQLVLSTIQLACAACHG